MAKSVSTVVSFNAGLLSSDLDGRVDIEQYRRGMSYCNNFVPGIAGTVHTRPGTFYRGNVGDKGYAPKLLRFLFSATTAYAVELGYSGAAGYARFWKNGALILSGGAPYSIVSPYAAADIAAVRYVQSGDVLFLVHPSYAPRTLTRTSDTSWAFATYTTIGGPFQDVNPDATTTMNSSARTGSVTITASAATFAATDVGRKLYVEAPAAWAYSPWQAGISYAAGARVRSDGKTYYTAGGGVSGAVTPTHDYGYQSDGTVIWMYEDPGYGWGTITAVAVGGLTATVTIESAIPQLAVTYASNRWAFGEWYTANYPSHIAFFRDRLVFARSTDQKMWFSVSGGYDDFRPKNDSGDVADDLAINIEIVGDGANGITWVSVLPEAIIVGTSGGVYTVAETTRNEVFGPKNVTSRQISDEDTADMDAVLMGETLAFLSKDGRRIMGCAFDADLARQTVSDLVPLSAGFANGGQEAFPNFLTISEMIGAGGPVPGLLFHSSFAGARIIGGIVRDSGQGVSAMWLGSLASSPGETASVESMVDQGGGQEGARFLLAVRRVTTSTGAVASRTIESIALSFGSGVVALSSPSIDCGRILASSAASPSILSLGASFANKTVNVWCYPAATLEWKATGKAYLADGSGDVTLEVALAHYCYVGYAFEATLQTMRLEAEDGASVTQPRRLVRAVVRCAEQRHTGLTLATTYPLALNVSSDFGVTKQALAVSPANLGASVMPASANRPKDYEAVLNGTTDTDGALTLVTGTATVIGSPCKVYLARVYMEVGDR